MGRWINKLIHKHLSSPLDPYIDIDTDIDDASKNVIKLFVLYEIAEQMDACDGFIRIAQYGGGTASLIVNVAANFVMHRLHIWSRTRSLC